MPSIYRISRPDPDAITDVDSVDAIEGPIRAGSPVRYHMDEISRDPFPFDLALCRRGNATEQFDGHCTLDPDPWTDR